MTREGLLGSVSRFFALLVVESRAFYAGAFRRLLPTYLGIGAVALFVFGPNGPTPQEVVNVMDASPASRSLAWALWLVVTASTGPELLGERSALVLRSLPLRCIWFLLVRGLYLLAMQSPWIVLWATGHSWGSAIVAGLGGAAAHSFLGASERRPRQWLGGIAVGALVLASSPWWMATMGLAPSYAVLLRDAWMRPAERYRVARTRRSPQASVSALAHAYLISVGRERRVGCVRTGVLVAVWSVLVSIALSNNDVATHSSAAALAVGIGSPAAIVAIGFWARGTIDCERRAREMYLAIGLRRFELNVAAHIAVAMATMLVSLVAVAGLVLQTGPGMAIRVAWSIAVWNLALGAAVLPALRFGERLKRRSAGRGLLVMTATVIAVFTVLAVLNSVVLAAICVAACALAITCLFNPLTVPEDEE